MNTQQFEEFKKITEEMYELHVKKNHDYGSGNIGALGEKGLYVRVWDKCSRLLELVWNGKAAQVADEKVEDTIKDLAIYCIIWLVYRRGMWGK